LRIIGIDYGSKRVGLAVTDPEQIIATTLATVASQEVMKYLSDYLAKEKVEAFVVGEVDEVTRGDISRLTNDFIKGLQKKFPEIPVYRQDESFSSQRAFETLVESGIGKKKRRDKGLVDRVSAVLILQAFLETRQKKL
jgi:putative holliday junction resolvase